jgi:hypothetical protein
MILTTQIIVYKIATDNSASIISLVTASTDLVSLHSHYTIAKAPCQNEI